MKTIKIKWHATIQEIPKIIWNNFLKGNSTPFYRWDWLNTLERSKSVVQNMDGNHYFSLLGMKMI